MINSATIYNVDGTHSCGINTDSIPLHDFDPTVTQRITTGRQKSQEHGVWPTLSFRDIMEIHVEGDIFGSSSSDYFSNRTTLLAAIFGDPNVPPVLTNRKLGDLHVSFDGASEVWKCEFTVSMFSAPLQGLSPMRTPWACTFVSWNPWFIGVTTGNKYIYV